MVTDCLPLAIKLLPLYIYILMGFISGKFLKAQPETVTRMMFYLISPLIIFNGVVNTRLDAAILTLPLLTFTISTCLCLCFYWIARRMWSDYSKNMMAFSAGSGATGYFGIPLAMLIFTPQVEGIYIMSLLGVTLYDNSVGYFVSAKGRHNCFDCIKKVLLLPSLYAFCLGLIVNLSQVAIPEFFHQTMSHLKGVYVVFGMMIVGLGLSTISTFKIDFKFIGMTFLAKFLIWPALILLIVFSDLHFFHLYQEDVHHSLILLSLVPLAVNMVILSSLLNYDSGKAATAVLLSALFAFFYVPLMIYCFIGISP